MDRKDKLSNYSHEMCEICDAPQWVMPNGEHRCMTIEQLQRVYAQDTEAFEQLHKYIDGLEKQIEYMRVENESLRGRVKDMDRNSGNH